MQKAAALAQIVCLLMERALKSEKNAGQLQNPTASTSIITPLDRAQPLQSFRSSSWAGLRMTLKLSKTSVAVNRHSSNRLDENQQQLGLHEAKTLPWEKAVHVVSRTGSGFRGRTRTHLYPKLGSWKACYRETGFTWSMEPKVHKMDSSSFTWKWPIRQNGMEMPKEPITYLTPALTKFAVYHHTFSLLHTLPKQTSVRDKFNLSWGSLFEGWLGQSRSTTARSMRSRLLKAGQNILSADCPSYPRRNMRVTWSIL